MVCSSFDQYICQIRFLIPAKLEGSYILLKPCRISCAQSFMSSQFFGYILFQMAPYLIEQLCSNELSFAFHFDHFIDLYLYMDHVAKWQAKFSALRSQKLSTNPIPTVACISDATSNQCQYVPPNPMSTVACTSDVISNQYQHAPPHPTLCPS